MFKNYYLTWGNNAPVKYQFSTSASGPWHDTMSANDKYRRDSLDGGTTWGIAYQFRGTDGKDGSDGSDANVPQWVKNMKATYIDNQWVISPHIYGGEITSDTVINVGTDATIGNKLIINASNFLGGIEFRYKDGEKIAEINVDPYTKALFINADGGIVINGQEYSPYAVFG